MEMPTTSIGGLEVSRIICGSNTFFGYSHFSAARDTWLKKYFDVPRIVEVMAKCAEFGVNCVLSGPVPAMHKAIQEVERQTGHHYVWICTPGMGNEDITDGLKWCADHGVEMCFPHTSWTDIRLNIAKNEIEGIEPVFEQIRNLGMIPGFSTHRPEVIIVSDSRGYDAQAYIQPFNVAGFLCSVETDWIARIIRNTPKPVVCIKPLAAGRIMPEAGLGYVFRNNKPIDPVCIGFLSPEEAEEDIRIALAIMEHQQASIELTKSRSKAHLA
ncbi:MAG: hypothetical protein QME62_02310 [Armatimonadota bacterium]|nr:hypothetical protein [Armatimonadota bacterium]